MVISIISIPTAAILGAILNSAKCSRVPGWHHSDSGYVAEDDLKTVEKHLTYQTYTVLGQHCICLNDIHYYVLLQWAPALMGISPSGCLHCFCCANKLSPY